MRHNLLTFILMFPAIWLQAQDQIFKNDNTKILAKITEVNPTEIRYKLFSNPEGPVYIEKRNNVSLIIYENGKHEIIAANPALTETTVAAVAPPLTPSISKVDSVYYYRYPNNISVNFLNFFNNEMGFMYQRDFVESDFNIQIPFGFGVEHPGITQSVYFNNNNFSNGNTFARMRLIKKNFEVGFGINYYPNLNTRVNYFIGPMFRYMQYNAEHQVTYSLLAPSPYGGYSYSGMQNQPTTLSRYCMSITNGFVFRTRSRLTASVYASLGFKNDNTDRAAKNPITGEEFDTFKSSTSLYFWSGFNVGFSF